MTTAEDYAAMIEDSGQNILLGVQGGVASATTLSGEQQSTMIQDEVGIETLSTALEAISEITAKTDLGLG